jgi:hypothetical protein
MAMGRIGMVMIVRDVADLVGVNIAYHRAAGVDAVWVLDNGSTDGTSDVLAGLAATDPAVHVRAEPGPFHQSELVGGLAAEAVADGVDWILPTDADEFWWSPDGSLRPALDAVPAGTGALAVEIVNFVQDRRVRQAEPSALRTMTWRATPFGTVADARRLVTDGTIAFVEMRYPPKWASRAAPGLRIHKGNHHVDGVPGPAVATDRLVLLHAPLRAAACLTGRAEHGRRSAAVEPDPLTSWHLRRIAQLEAEGRLEAEWVANSRVGGALGLSGPGRLRPDDRLAEAVGPFLPRRGGIRSRLAGRLPGFAQN